jgi:hypothetical protein
MIASCKQAFETQFRQHCWRGFKGIDPRPKEMLQASFSKLLGNLQTFVHQPSGVACFLQNIMLPADLQPAVPLHVAMYLRPSVCS